MKQLTINLKYIQAAHATQFQKNKWPNQKMGQRTKQTFSKEHIQMANKHMKIRSRSLIIRKMQIKTIMRYHLTTIRMAAIKMSTNNKCWRGCGEKGTLLYHWLECKLVQPLWRTVWRFLKKLGIDLPYDPATPLLGIYYPLLRENRDWKRHMYPNVHSSSVYSSQDTEATDVHRQMNG